MQSRVLALAMMLMVVPTAWAQAASAEGSAVDARAAMERAKRAAAGPLKAIQQAAKIRRRPGEADPAETWVAARATTAVQVAPAAAVPATPASERPTVGAETPADVRMLVAEARIARLTTVADIEVQATATAKDSTVAMVDWPPLLDAGQGLPIRLNTPEPSIPAHLLEQGPRVDEVEAELSLRADGSVAEVTLVSPVPRTWQRFITTALEQWRYEPVGSPRMHRVHVSFQTATAR